MSFPSSTFTVLLVALSFICGGCRLWNKDKVNNRSDTGSSSGIIESSSAAIERTATGQTMVVRFKTTETAQCLLKYGPTDTPDQDLKKMDCQSKDDKQITFYEVIKSIDVQKRYKVSIRAWPTSKNESQASQLDIQEVDSSSGNELMFLRYDHGRGTAELRNYDFSSATERQEFLKSSMDPSSKCTFGEQPESFSFPKKPEKSIKIVKAASYGFATTSSQPKLSADSKSLYFEFSNAENGDRWEWVYEWLGITKLAYSNAPSLINTLEVQGENKTLIENTTLDPSTAEVQWKASSKLSISWSVNQPSSSSRIRITIGSPGAKQKLHCDYPTQLGFVDLPSEWTSKLTNGINELYVTLDSRQSMDVTLNAGAPWLIYASDWRFALVNKI